ncbi:MAG: hypothetical protein HY722_00065 [Planctomycetes bacterium]|nr:hypothetical protein [Planctomycetota bacterium]
MGHGARAAAWEGDRGTVLLFALGMLSLLALVGATLSILVRVERMAAESYLSGVRARLAVQAGLEAARGGLAHALSRDAFLGVRDTWCFRSDDGLRPGCGTPLDGALHPSFERVLPPAPGLAGGPVSGWIEGAGRPRFTLKVQDCQGQLDLNGTQPAFPEMLEALGRAIADEYGLPNPVPPGRGRLVVEARTRLYGGRFRAKAGLALALRQGAGPWTAGEVRDYRNLADFVTVHGEVDHSMVAPLPGGPPLGPCEPERLPRSPVNLNTASVPVLVACLAGLQGSAWTWRNQPQVVLGEPTVRLDEESVGPMAYATALDLARRIHERRLQVGAFTSWQDFRTFLESVLGSDPSAERTVDLVLASADPRLRPLWSELPLGLARTVGKLRLDPLTATTELTLQTGGAFEVECLARVHTVSGDLAAEATAHRVIRVVRTTLHATQRDFEQVGRDPAGAPLYRGVQTGPESVTARGVAGASDCDGFVSLSSEMGPASWPGESFFSPFNAGLDAALAKGSATATPAKEPRSPLCLGGQLAPDGVHSWREPGAMKDLFYDTQANVPLESGRAGMWVRLHLPPEAGSDECLLYTVVPDPDQDGGGVMWRLERYGPTLKSTRVYYGVPSKKYVLSRFPYCYSETVMGIGSWRPGEWHYVEHIWWAGVEQFLYVDGRRAALYNTIPTRIEVPRGWQGPYPSGDVLYLDFIVEVIQKAFRLRTYESRPRLWVGGYRYYNPSSTDIYDLGAFGSGTKERFANASIDELRVWDAPSSSPAGYVPYSRFQVSEASPAVYEGSMALPDGALRVLGLTYDVEVPRWWDRREVDPSLSPEALREQLRKELVIELSVRRPSDGQWVVLGPEAGTVTSVAEGFRLGGYSLELPLWGPSGPVRTLEYRFRVTRPEPTLRMIRSPIFIRAVAVATTAPGAESGF